LAIISVGQKGRLSDLGEMGIIQRNELGKAKKIFRLFQLHGVVFRLVQGIQKKSFQFKKSEYF